MLLVVLDILGRVVRQTSPDRGRRWGVGKGEQGRASVSKNLDLLLVAGKP